MQASVGRCHCGSVCVSVEASVFGCVGVRVGKSEDKKVRVGVTVSVCVCLKNGSRGCDVAS